MDNQWVLTLEARCCECRRLLFKVTVGALRGLVQIKCPRCNACNDVRPDGPNQPRQASNGTGAACGLR
ncbi:Com family DNA-binding transcriptional regulator [Pseudogemmobacter lacusdianii]|uniref:Com family DNA-binding transcriptional regulator n=1 Tax=Pseudogemmobacter lacusdianii TaxID=3069608 RepID=UPI0035936827